MEPMEQTSAVPPTEWLFLSKYFALLGECGSRITVSRAYPTPEDGVHVDVDTKADDVWIPVDVTAIIFDTMDQAARYDDSGSDSGSYSDEYEDDSVMVSCVLQHLGLLRDAIILTSLVGKTDYDGWLAMLTTVTQFKIAQKYQRRADGHAVPRIPIQFEFRLSDEHKLRFLEWSTCLGHLVGNLNHCVDFDHDLQAVEQELTRRGVSYYRETEPTKVKLQWSFYNPRIPPSEVSHRLLCIMDAIHRTQRMEQAARETKTSRGVLLRVTTLEAQMHDSSLNDSTIEALMRLLQLGVRFSRLYVPGNWVTAHLPSLHVWCPFVRLLTGVDLDFEGRVASVEDIIMDGSYTGRLHFAPFCSALACARGVHALTLLCNTCVDTFGSCSVGRAYVWRWLTFALLSRASSTSVKRLCICGERPLPDDLAVINTMAESSSPLDLLLEGVSGIPILPSNLSRSVSSFRPHIVFRVTDGRHTAECYSPRELTGELLSDWSMEGERIAYIPGYGLCWGVLFGEAYTHKRTVTAAHATPLPWSSSIETLVLEPGDIRNMVVPQDFRGAIKNDFPPQGLLGLLTLIGARLRGLQFTMETDDETLEQILSLCPKLERLCIGQATLLSMDPFTQAYANGATLTSLRLCGVQIPEEALQDFARTLAVVHPTKGSVAFTLERLHWDFVCAHPLRIQTLRILESVLQQNTVMTHLNGQYILPTPMELAIYNGQRVPGWSPRQKRQLVSLFGALRVVGGHAAQMDGYTKELIWIFAVGPRYRQVDWCGRYRYRN